MDREHHANERPNRLLKYLESRLESQIFRLRAVLIFSNGGWSLLCCAIEGFRSNDHLPEPVSPQQYSQAILHEEWLTGRECLAFSENLQAGRANFGEITLDLAPSAHWSTEFVSVRNDFMPHAGFVIAMSWGQSSPAPVRALVALLHPYYPDSDEAARDWLPFPLYHGHSDGKNNQVLFLLPEERAFMSNSEYNDDGLLQVTLSGNEVRSLPLMIKGAYWEERTIHHIESAVSNAKANLTVPANADRLEYYLIDGTGTVYDFYREDRYSRLRDGGGVLNGNKRSLSRQVRQAISDGEGLHVEFKPFVDLQRTHSANGQKTKLHEVITTVVAFANTAGGSVYLGIDDDCSLSGIDRQLSAWAQGPADDANLARYIGALKASIKDQVQGEVSLTVCSVQLDGALILAIDVAPAVAKPVIIRQDYYLYARKGASNRRIPPDEWQATLNPNAESAFLRGLTL